MKLKNKLQFAMIAILGVGLIACNNDDDGGGPSKPKPTGTMTGTFFDYNTLQESDWAGSSVTATYDTVSNKLIIRALGTGGSAIKIQLNDTAVNFYFMGSQTSNYSEFYKNNNIFSATTKHNDPGLSTVSFALEITENDTATISGNIGYIAWYKVNPGPANDVLFASLENVVFENVPITYKSVFYSSNSTMNASVDGNAFTSSNVTVNHGVNSGYNIIGSSNTATNISFNLPDTVSAGTTYDLGGLFSPFSAQYTTFGGGSNYSTTGEVTVSAYNRLNGTMNGTFEFDTNNESVSNGTFSLVYE